MLDAVVSGEVYAAEGTIGGFSIGATRISSPHIAQGGYGTEVMINSGTLATNPGDYGRIDVTRVTEAGRKVVASLDNGGGTFEHVITDSLDVVGAASIDGGVYMKGDFYFKQPLNANIKKANGVPYQGKIGLIQVSPNVYALGLID